MEENKTVVEAAPEVAPAVVETKTVLNASVAPENFDWDAFENEDVYGASVEEIAEQYNQTLSKVVEGEVVEGVVTAISKREVIVNIGYKSEGVIMAPEFRYNQDLAVGDKVEVFVDLGGVDGLIHITDLSWGRINHPEEVVALDQKINVVILDFDESKKRIALGLKQLTVHPWDALDANIKVGDKVKGKVVLIADYGAFVEIEPGVEGLIHVSEMSWSPRLRIASEFLKAGDEVEAQILTLDREEKKMSLGLKQLVANPWESIREKYAVGTKHTATVRNITNFGVFAELEEGIEGLIHISDLSWNKIKHPSELVAAGDAIEVTILGFDEENHKLSLGHKQLLPNPWDEVEAKYAVGTVVEAKIASVNEKGAVIELEGDVDAFCFNRELVKEDGKMPVSGETLSFKVTELKKSAKKVTLSHAKTYAAAVEARAERAAAEADNTKKAVKKINSSVEKTTLGDLDALAALKSQLENK